jgi:hypothetical protein
MRQDNLRIALLLVGMIDKRRDYSKMLILMLILNAYSIYDQSGQHFLLELAGA